MAVSPYEKLYSLLVLVSSRPFCFHSKPMRYVLLVHIIISILQISKLRPRDSKITEGYIA